MPTPLCGVGVAPHACNAKGAQRFCCGVFHHWACWAFISRCICFPPRSSTDGWEAHGTGFGSFGLSGISACSFHCWRQSGSFDPPTPSFMDTFAMELHFHHTTRTRNELEIESAPN